MFGKKKPKLFEGMTEEELYEQQVVLMDVGETVGLTNEEYSALITAVQAMMAVRHALINGGKIDWKAWDAR